MSAIRTSRSKANFDDLYVRPDPRPLYTRLRVLDYRLPELALPVVAAVHTGGTVLDVCCSYGVGAAQLRHAVSIADLAARYRDPALADLDPPALVAADREFFAARGRRRDVRVVGLDASTPAIRYALDVGLMADGWAEDLERSQPSAALVAGLADVTTITCTGGVGYVGAATFRRLLDAHPNAAGLRAVLFVLRVFDHAEVVRVFTDRGLVVEPLPGVTFPQRRFAGAAEQDSALRDLADRRIDAAGKEDSGWFHAECLVVRPPVEAARVPIGDLTARISAQLSPFLAGPGTSGGRAQATTSSHR